MNAYLKRIAYGQNETGISNISEIIEVDESEIIPGKAKIIGYWRDPSIEAFKKRVNIEAGDVCPCGHVFLNYESREMSIQEYEQIARPYFPGQIYRCWIAGHFDIPIYKEIT